MASTYWLSYTLLFLSLLSSPNSFVEVTLFGFLSLITCNSLDQSIWMFNVSFPCAILAINCGTHFDFHKYIWINSLGVFDDLFLCLFFWGGVLTPRKIAIVFNDLITRWNCLVDEPCRAKPLEALNACKDDLSIIDRYLMAFCRWWWCCWWCSDFIWSLYYVYLSAHHLLNNKKNLQKDGCSPNYTVQLVMFGMD